VSLGKVLVTGGAGFIGCALSQELASHAESWVVMDSMHPQVHTSSERPQSLHPAAHWIKADVTKAEDWNRVLSEYQPEVVIHLAAETGTAQSLNEATRHSLVNVVGTTEMTDAFGRNDSFPDHVILTSSRAVYGEGNWQKATGEVVQPGMRSHQMLESGVWDFPNSEAIPSSASTTVPAPTSVYGATKLAQEHLLTAWGGSRGVAISILRLQNVYGAGQSLSNPYTGIVSLFSQVAMKGEPIPLYEDGKIVRDFVYIDDVISALVEVISAGPNNSYPVLDIGTGIGATIYDLAREISNYHSSPEPFVTGQFRDGDVRFAACDISVSLDAIDWQPQVSLKQGVAKLQEWIATELGNSSGEPIE
jgi:dTDP-L-rhamnose 4-epimerase